jgi:hypothetical protein
MRLQIHVTAAALAWLAVWTTPCAAFYVNGTWATTAHGPVAPAGNPATLTWSIVPDGTGLSIGGTSNLISFLDGQFGAGPGGADLSQRPWFSVVNSTFARWTELGGLTWEYESLDDGATHGSFLGSLGIRGDVRLAGKFLDGVGGSNGSAGFVPNADITLETADPTFFYNLAVDPTHLNFRNTLAHEAGHALGLAHMGNPIVLMYHFSSDDYDGPQFDDIRGLHQQFGDALEKAGSGAGNNTLATATLLGMLAPEQTVTLGADGNTGTNVAPTENDFLSISNANDLDYFRFSISEPSWVDATVTPIGPSYGQRVNSFGMFTTINAATASDLRLDLYALVGEAWELRGSAAGNPIGVAESLLDSPLEAGDYAVKITGSTSVVQTYQLQVFSESRIPGDFDHNNLVDAADFLAWQRGLGMSRTADELHDWREHFGQIALLGAASRAVPEPPTLLAAAFALMSGRAFRRQAGRLRITASGFPPRPELLKRPNAASILGTPE